MESINQSSVIRFQIILALLSQQRKIPSLSSHTHLRTILIALSLLINAINAEVETLASMRECVCISYLQHSNDVCGEECVTF